MNEKPPIILHLGNHKGIRDIGLPQGMLFEDGHRLGKPTGDIFAEYYTLPPGLPLNELKKICDDIQKRYQILGILNVFEEHVELQSQLTHYLGLLGNPPDQVGAALDKVKMKKRFQDTIDEEYLIPFSKVENDKDLFSFIEKFRFPLILKPNNLMGSLFISICHNQETLLKKYHEMENHISRYQSAVIVEPYIKGTLHSIDCVIDQKGTVYPTPIVDMLSGYELGKKDFHHLARYAPSQLPQSICIEAQQLAQKAAEALHLRNCIAHIEIISTPTGLKLLEVAARPGGDRIDLLQAVFGIDLLQAYYDILLGKTICIHPKKPKPFAIVTPYPSKVCTFNGSHIERLIDQLQAEARYKIKVKPGDHIGSTSDGFFSPISISLSAHRIQDILNDIQKIANNDDLFSSTPN